MMIVRPGEEIDGRYRVLGLLGRGGMADVIRCYDPERRREVAVKILSRSNRHSAEFKRRLTREAELASTVVHENVVEILGTGATPHGDPYLVMELLTGETLRELVEREGSLSTERALPLIRQAAAGLAAAHQKSIVHRDVKPSNLFLCGPVGSASCLKVFDFGFARAPYATMGSAGNVMGTLEYMAPEQIVSEPADARADVYSLGVVMFRLLTRELPFDRASDKDMLAHHLISAPPPPSWLIEGLDQSVETVILTAMRKNPANRYATMSEMLADIDRILQMREVVGVPLTSTPDRYVPTSQLGQRAMQVFQERHGISA
jgi:serine/threonine-protein kinase